MPPALFDLQRRCSRSARDGDAGFGEHRRRLTRLALATPGDTLVVLGAGTCKDLDLEMLARHHRQIHLCDIDARALRRARAQQPPAIAGKLVLHAPLDLSGAFHRLAGLGPRGMRPTDVAEFTRLCVDGILDGLPGGNQTVLSSCFLSQLLHGSVLLLGIRHAQLHVISCALALAHARSIALLLAPGGRGIIATDMTSSNSFSLDQVRPGRDLATLAFDLERTGNCAAGTGPAFLHRLVREDDVVGPLLAGVPRPVDPWLWRFGPQLSYLVHALVIERRGGRRPV
jgi:hypothetical protein